MLRVLGRRRSTAAAGATAILLSAICAAAPANAGDAGREPQQPTALATASALSYFSCEEDESQSVTRAGVLGTDEATVRATRGGVQSDPTTGEDVLDVRSASSMRVQTRARRGTFSRVEVRARLSARVERFDSMSACAGAGRASTAFVAPLDLPRPARIEIGWAVSGPRRLELAIENSERDWIFVGGSDIRRGTATVRLAKGTYELRAEYDVGAFTDEDDPPMVDKITGGFEVGLRVVGP